MRARLRHLAFLWHEQKEKFWSRLAFAIPRPLVYWASIRLMANATTGKYSNQVVPELMAVDALQRWEMPCHGS